MSVPKRGGYSAGSRTVSELPAPPPSVTVQHAIRRTATNEETYCWRGVNPRGEQVAGGMTIDPAHLAAIVEDRWRMGWQSLVVCRGTGPVPLPAVSPADVVAKIEKRDNGYLGWWAEGPQPLKP